MFYLLKDYLKVIITNINSTNYSYNINFGNYDNKRKLSEQTLEFSEFTEFSLNFNFSD